jgi:hypothetical protein
LRAVVAVVLVLAACGHPPPERAPTEPSAPADPHALRRDAARVVLERACGSCHISTEPTALQAALAVYDLTELDWSARMTDAQLLDMVQRMDAPLPPDGEPNGSTPEEREAVRVFVDAEIARRAG